MTALLVNGPRDGQKIQISHAVESIICTIEATDKVFVMPDGVTIERKAITGTAKYRLAGVRGDFATYKFQP